MTTTIHSLPNGMSVILEENHVRPVISFNVLVKIGSACETDNEAGMCHVIEHMLFKGTPTYPVGEIAKNIEAAGGDINAYTSFDQTVFYINMASMFADKGLAILADAIQNPLFDATELAREKEVILEEIRREKDHPARIISEELFRQSFKQHTYGRPIIGFPETVKSFTKDQLKAFYKKWYTPKNMVFIVVGDFDRLEMLDKLREQFAKFRGPPPPKCLTLDLKEPQQLKPELIIKTANIQNVHLAMAWHIPGITHHDVPALDVASHILGGSDSSRLEQEVKERKGIVHHISCYAYTPKDPGLLTISALMSDKHVSSSLEAILNEVHKLHEEPVAAEELSRAKLNLRSSEIYEKETVGGQGGKLAYFLATAGSHEFEERYFQMLQGVQTDAVREVARQHMTVSNLTCVLLVPNDSKWPLKKKELTELFKAPKKKPAKRKTKKEEESPIHTMRLKNGMKLVVKENHHLPLIAFCATTYGGLRYETTSTNGISSLMARTITKGTQNRSAVGIAKDIEKIAGHVEGFSARNTVGLKCEFLSDYLHDGFALFGDVLTHPKWDLKEVNKEKKFVIEAIRDQEDSLGTMAFIHFLKALYPKHPYGLRTLGTAKSIRSMSADSIKKFYKRIFRPSQMVLSVVGDVNPNEIAKLAEEFLADLPKGETHKPKIPHVAKNTSPIITEKYKKEKQQAHIVLGFHGTTIKSKDRYIFTVLNNILAGQGGRLFITLRDQMGLAYVVSSMNHEGIEPGYFAVYMGTEPAKVDIAIEGINAELEKVTANLVGEDEIDRAKRYIVGSYELESQRNSALANSYALNELYGLGIDEVEQYPKKILAVTRKDVLHVAQKYINLKAPVISIIRPE